MSDSAWWRNAVFYEIYVRSFADGDGDGVGDLPGIRSRLRHVADLGVDALWLTPFYPSPQADHGYDVADYCDVDPLFGTLDDFDGLLSDAHALGLKVTIDIVPNHTSNQHPWFLQAVADGPGAPSRERYFFRPPRGERPPNNWRSTFGGSAWTTAGDGECYLHLFAPEQPDLNWRHPDVAREFERILRFWLDRGVDGFRIDVAHGLFKAPGLPDQHSDLPPDLMAETAPDTPMWNQPEVHEVYRDWRRIADGYPGGRPFVGEVWLGDPWAQAAYVRPDELELTFNFRLLKSPWQAGTMRTAIDRSLVALGAVGAPSTWVLSNHDVQRHVTRYGGGTVGLRRARAALLLVLSLPGPVFLYAGEELGLPEADVPDDAKQDPQWRRSHGTKPSRDGCRVPLPWSGRESPYGFSAPGVRPWLPMPASWADLAAATQASDPGSTLCLYRDALRHRAAEAALRDGGPLRWLDSPADTLVHARRSGDAALVCAVNLGEAPTRLPDGEIVLASEPLPEPGWLPPDAAAWVRVG
jgi:alpha-glucosidase